MRSRRKLLYAGAALGAGLAGAAWWQFRASAGAAAVRSADPFWALELETPEGAPLKISRFAGQALLVNFWATWCPPCVEELPMLSRFAQEQQSRGWRVLGLAVDQPSSVRAWLAKSPLAFPVAMAGLGGTDLSKRMGNLSGALPFSVAFSASGQVLQRKGGKLTPEDLAVWVKLA
jgi:thiol-disulfide isomerase/thioredoxin